MGAETPEQGGIHKEIARMKKDILILIKEDWIENISGAISLFYRINTVIQHKTSLIKTRRLLFDITSL